MRFSLIFNLFFRPVFLGTVGFVMLNQGEGMMQMPNLALQGMGQLLAYAGAAVMLAGCLWALWGCVRMLRATLGHGILCYGCGGPVNEKRGRWGDYYHCLNCGQNRSIRH